MGKIIFENENGSFPVELNDHTLEYTKIELIQESQLFVEGNPIPYDMIPAKNLDIVFIVPKFPSITAMEYVDKIKQFIETL